MKPGRTFTRIDSLKLSSVLMVLFLVVSLVAPMSASASELPTLSDDSAVSFAPAGWESATVLSGTDPTRFSSSLWSITQQINARSVWSAGFTGEGVDIAIIDSGVVPVNGLTSPGKVINGPDLSFESQNEDLRYLDTFGHGTHLAGIMAGRDDATPPDYSNASSDFFVGVAPDSRILSVKVADSHGTTDVSQVIAAIDWVVQHRGDNGMNVRVLNLAFGTDGIQDYMLDPLTHAVEQAWKAGIVVVVAAGNDGNDVALRNPAYDPFVIAVGAVDQKGTDTYKDDEVAEFSNCGTSIRNVDILAPGRSVVSLRNPGSYADVNNPQSIVADRFIIGSGSSQATAVVSGVAALILDKFPNATPDQVKELLTEHASRLKNTSGACSGVGVVDASGSIGVRHLPRSDQTAARSRGFGSLDAARGSFHLEHEGVILDGEQDIFGTPWDAETWAKMSASGLTWSGGDWNGVTWSGDGWSGLTWSGLTWSGVTWSGLTWSGLTWSGLTWSGLTWSGVTWSGLSWSGITWSGLSWSSSAWSGVTWD